MMAGTAVAWRTTEACPDWRQVARRACALTLALPALIWASGCHQGAHIKSSVDLGGQPAFVSPQVVPAAQEAVTAPAEELLAQGAQAEGDHARLAAEDPLGFLRLCLTHGEEHVRDYRCLFTLQERVARALSPCQRIRVKFRAEPFSVDLRWEQNPTRARRVTYVAGRRRDAFGRESAGVEPIGVAGVFLPRVTCAIHGTLMRAASRRPLDQFGFVNTLRIMIENCARAEREPEYELRYLGTGSVAGRPCYVLRRRLPYAGPNGEYPERWLVAYLDQEWLVPTACISFADDRAEQLMGSYVLTEVEFNVTLTDEDF